MITAEQFYVIKGLLALTATLMLIYHMSRTWADIATRSQRLRYLTLLYFAALITYSSVEQAHDHTPVSSRNIFALVGVLLLVYTMFVSIRDEVLRRHRGRRP